MYGSLVVEVLSVKSNAFQRYLGICEYYSLFIISFCRFLFGLFLLLSFELSLGTIPLLVIFGNTAANSTFFPSFLDLFV